MKEKVLEILNSITEGTDYENEIALIDEGILTSLDIIQLIGSLSDEFDISIPATEITPNNFNSVNAVVALVERLQEE